MPDQKEYYMRRALALAARGAGHVDPNPMVGCVIVKDGRIIAEGWHEHIGGLHAERNAFAHCTEDAAGADLYVTLEPCCHWGRTPPCTDAVIEHRIRRVFVGCLDPNPLVAGKGAQILRDAGIEVETGVCEAECREINEVFFHYITAKTPFVVMKYAMTADGKIATVTGASKWITGENARNNVHQDRHRYSGIMAGIGTVLADDPMLNCRLPGGRNPVRIICDSSLRTPIDSNIVKTAGEIPTIIATVRSDEKRRREYEDRNVRVITTSPKDGRVDLRKLMIKLGELGIDSVLLEGGAGLNFSALEAGIVNRVKCYIAPKIFGGDSAKTPVGGRGVELPANAFMLGDAEISRFDEDILIEWKVR